MNHVTPLELLTERLEEYKKALIKSRESFASGQIDEETHQKHIRNLNDKIFEFNCAINILKNKR